MAKQTQRKKPAAKADPAQAVLDAALRLAATIGWRHATLADIASEAGLTLAELYALYPSKASILAAIMHRADEQVLRGADGEAGEESVRDRLFDVVMRRFDALAPHKDALRNIVRDVACDPMESACVALSMGRSLTWMLESAGVRSGGLAGAARVKGLGAIYLATMRVWLNDDSEDQGKTMAALDRHLARAERMVSLLPGRRGRAAPEAEAA
jgi:AcrR family transcriptional regulator